MTFNQDEILDIIAPSEPNIPPESSNLSPPESSNNETLQAQSRSKFKSCNTNILPPAISNPRIHPKPPIAMIYSHDSIQLFHKTTKSLHGDRDILLASLLHSCGFLSHSSSFKSFSPLPFLKIFPPRIASFTIMEQYFHSKDYLQLLQSTPSETSLKNHSIETLERYGLTDDCPLPSTSSHHNDFWQYCQLLAGSSLHAAHLLITNKNINVSIHWGGGRHHAQPSKASGFCYINDVVLAIQHLLVHKSSSSSSKNANATRVLYLDIDVHHGDAVQTAFYHTSQVLTCSFHRHDVSFFPYPSGSHNEKGTGEGLGYNINIPLPPHCQDEDFAQMMTLMYEEILPVYNPKYVVMCVGADGLQKDPLLQSMGEDGWKFTPEGIAKGIQKMSHYCHSKNIKLLLLGGGGYKDTQTALTYLQCTAAACEGCQPGFYDNLPRDIPKQDQFFDRYGPTFELKSHHDTIQTNSQPSKEYYQVLKDGKECILLASRYMQGKDIEQSTVLRSYQSFQDGGGMDTRMDDTWKKETKQSFKNKRKKKRRINKL